MPTVETELTPELAAQLLANPNPKQRRIDRQTVAQYVRAITEGRWRLVPDPIQVAGEAGMFNGGHRCTAVIAARKSIPVYIDWDADPPCLISSISGEAAVPTSSSPTRAPVSAHLRHV
jgi:hypothetical protein